MNEEKEWKSLRRLLAEKKREGWVPDDYDALAWYDHENTEDKRGLQHSTISIGFVRNPSKEEEE